MKTIYKYQLETTDFQTVMIPEKSNIIALQTQYEKPCIWVEVETENEKVPHVFRIFGTGHELQIGLGMTYVGTYQIMNGSFVGHVYLTI
jgi:hypothetical protein